MRSSHSSSTSAGRAFSAGKDPMIPLLHCSITRSGVLTINIGAPITGSTIWFRSFSTKAKLDPPPCWSRVTCLPAAIASSGIGLAAVPRTVEASADAPGKPFYSPEAVTSYLAALKRQLQPNVKLIEVDAHINDDVFAQRAVDTLLEISPH